MKIYEVYYERRESYDYARNSYGYFSTRKKAEELLNIILKYDDWRFDSEGYYINEIEIDHISDETTKYIEMLRKNWEYEQSCIEEEES